MLCVPQMKRTLDLRVLRQAEVIVRAEVQDATPISELDPRPLGRADEALAFPGTRLVDAGELLEQVLLKSFGHGPAERKGPDARCKKLLQHTGKALWVCETPWK
jgi:hypothetical protein